MGLWQRFLLIENHVKPSVVWALITTDKVELDHFQELKTLLLTKEEPSLKISKGVGRLLVGIIIINLM